MQCACRFLPERGASGISARRSTVVIASNDQILAHVPSPRRASTEAASGRRDDELRWTHDYRPRPAAPRSPELPSPAHSIAQQVDLANTFSFLFYSTDAQIAGSATGAMSYAFISAIKKNPQQSYVGLLNSIRDELEGKYDQKPQLSCSHPLGKFDFGSWSLCCLFFRLLIYDGRYEFVVCDVEACGRIDGEEKLARAGHLFWWR